VGYLQNRIGENHIPKKKYVDIQSPLSPAPFPRPVPAKGSFNFLNAGQKPPGAAAVKTCNSGVKKTALIGNIEGICLIERGSAEILYNLRQILTGGLQDFPGVQAAEGPV
jgi:hypothetical protein